MASPTTHRWLTIAILAGCSAFGAYATFGTSSQNGLFAAISKAVGTNVKQKSKHFPGGPAPYKLTYTGVAGIDDHLVTLISFFTIILDGPKTQDVVWVTRYLLTQFLAGWILISLEGLRQGNQGRIVSWTGTLGFIFQNLTYTVSVPIYLIIHLLTSPVSSVNPSPATFAIDTQDLFVLPLSITGAFVVPTVMMALPAPAMVSAASHYSWQAAWQIFPVTQSATHKLYKRITAPLSFKHNFHEQLDDIYRAVALLSFAPQTALLAVAATPASLVPELVYRYVPGLTKEVFQHLDLTKAFVPCMPWNSPVYTTLSSKVVSAKGLPELVKLFLQWDVYLGGTALLAWSVFVYSVARPEKSFLSSILPKIAVYTVLGGPVGAATMLLWERDSKARQQAAQPKAIEGVSKKSSRSAGGS
ncbi:hypothetical protein N0V93_004551 [Gnomoniopsis smithogilvyi]|uniref:Uncharacterized protein n=1 Tax=Gnomoniopsis smithogilvyi TaxID=1191159 RepID=A0A9W8YRB1_9PEZI|nr:hypothetical protein N0V93_004551 [Gnomoniopsis smithogilvyi]